MHNPTIHHFGEVTSTMDVARELFDAGHGDGTVVIAQFQTKGRGRPGRTWIAEKGKQNFLTTLTLKIEKIPTNVLSFIISLSIIETLQDFGITNLLLKWPNDILLRHKKLGGMIIEKIADEVYTIGIGLNFEYSPAEDTTLTQELLFLPTSLVAEGFGDLIPTPDEFVFKLFEKINSCEKTYVDSGFTPIRERWLSHHLPVGSAISFKPASIRLTGTFEGLSPDGHLIFRGNDGITKTFASGDVFI